MSVHERVESYSGNLALATQRDRAGIYSSSQTQTTPFQCRGAVSNIASKCPGSETRDRLSARERSSRASPTKRPGERFLQPLFGGSDRAVGSTDLADPGQEGHAIPGGRLGVAPEPGTMEPSCVADSGLSEELNALQSRVIDTLTEARAPSTRRLYALKWGLFVKWCHQAHIDPVTCTVSDVLSFLQYRLDSGSLPSTLKVYVAAIAAFRPRRADSRSAEMPWW